MAMRGPEIVANGIAKHILTFYQIGRFFVGMFGKIVAIILYILKVGPGRLIELGGAQALK